MIYLFNYSLRENFANTKNKNYFCYAFGSNKKEDILKQNSNFIKDKQLFIWSDAIIENFINPKFFESNISLGSYLADLNVPSNKINLCIQLIKNIINNNCMISAMSDYIIGKNTSVLSIMNTWVIDNIRNDLICFTNEKDNNNINLIIKDIVSIFSSPFVEICSNDNFIDYCNKMFMDKQSNKINRKQIESFALGSSKIKDKKNNIVAKSNLNQMDKLIKLNNIINSSNKFMQILSFKEQINNFNSKSFGESFEKYMDMLLDKFNKNNLRNFQILNKGDFNNFILLLIDEINILVKKIKETNSDDELDKLINDFSALKQIYHNLKMYYVLIESQNVINRKLPDDRKNQALQCCSKIGENNCFDFAADPNYPLPFMYGFGEFGYVKYSKCLKESDESKILIQEQNMTLDELLGKKHESWKNMSNENKQIVLNSITKLLKYNNINLKNMEQTISLNELKIGDIRKQIKQNKNTLGKLVEIQSDDFVINKFILNSPSFRKKEKEIQNINQIDLLQNEIKLMETGAEQKIMLNSKMSLSMAKSLTLTILIIREMFKNFGFSNSLNIISELIGISSGSKTAGEILLETNILPRYHPVILKFIISAIENGKFATVTEYTLDSIPSKVISFSDAKPKDINLNMCDIYPIMLDKLRKDRLISPDEFITYEKKIILHCNPNSVPTENIKSNDYVVNPMTGLPVIQKKFNNFNEFVKESNSDVVSDNILFNFMKNTVTK